MSGKTKNRVLLLGVVLILLLCYRFAISNTLNIRQEHATLQAEQRLFENAPEQLALLVKKQKHYDSILNKMNLGNTAMENNLLRIINLEVEKQQLKLLDFNEPHIAAVAANQLNTYDFTLEGSFTGILKTIYAIEQKNSFGEVVHLDFQKKRNYRTNKYYLTARIFIQNIE